MINGERIGVGIVTCDRKALFEKLVNSLIPCNDIDKLVVVSDTIKDRKIFTKDSGPDYCSSVLNNSKMKNWSIHYHEANQGVGKSKNKALQHLLDDGCDHIFIIEDDIFIKDPTVFQKYIEASKVTGIQHFNFSQHGIMNKVGYSNNGKPNPNFIIDYGSAKVSFFTHCVGAFSYYSAAALKEVGLMDERYYNACEHVDHTYNIIKAGMHPPFWNFVDIENSQDYLGDEPWTKQNSTISSRPDHQTLMTDADKIFVDKHGMLPMDIPIPSGEEIYKSIKEIKNKYEK